MQIKEYCLKLENLLSEANEEDWAKAFNRIYMRLEDHDETQKVLFEMMNMYGGMASFNDIILYKNGNVDVNGSNKLDMLRKGLFSELKKELQKNTL